MTHPTDVPLLSEFLRFLETGDVPPESFADDVFFDMNVPSWRYQLQGHAAAAGLHHSDGPVQAKVGAVLPTATGFVAEVDYVTMEGGAPVYYRSLSLITVHDGLISNVIHYCTGPWDAATRARQAREAPMLRAE